MTFSEELGRVWSPSADQIAHVPWPDFVFNSVLSLGVALAAIGLVGLTRRTVRGACVVCLDGRPPTAWCG